MAGGGGATSCDNSQLVDLITMIAAAHMSFCSQLVHFDRERCCNIAAAFAMNLVFTQNSLRPPSARVEALLF